MRRKWIKRLVYYNGTYYKITPKIERVLTKHLASIKLVKAEQNNKLYIIDLYKNKLYMCQVVAYVNNSYKRVYTLSVFPEDIQKEILESTV